MCVCFTLEREQQTHNPECVQEVLVLTDRRLRGGRKKKGGGSGAGEKWDIGTCMNGWLMCGKEKDRCPTGSETYFQKKETYFKNASSANMQRRSKPIKKCVSA